MMSSFYICPPDEFQNFVRKLPTFYALNTSAIQYFWTTEPTVHQRYKQLELNTQQLLSKAKRIIGKLFNLSKKCRTQPKIITLRERYNFFDLFWWHHCENVCVCGIPKLVIMLIIAQTMYKYFDIPPRVGRMSNMSDLMTWLESRSVSPSHPGNQSYPPVKLKFAVFLDVYAIFRTFYLTPIPSRQVSSFFFFHANRSNHSPGLWNGM